MPGTDTGRGATRLMNHACALAFTRWAESAWAQQRLKSIAQSIVARWRSLSLSLRFHLWLANAARQRKVKVAPRCSQPLAAAVLCLEPSHVRWNARHVRWNAGR